MTEKIKDQKLIAAIISSPTIEEAAKVAEVNPRTIYRKLKNPEFKSALDVAQNQVLSSAVMHMIALCRKATMKFEQLLDADSERVQLQAARSIFQFSSPLRREVEFEERLLSLENEKKRRKFISEETDD